MLKIVFICTGNTCRSPMAAAICNKIAQQMGLSGEISADSCGLMANTGEPVSENAKKAIFNLFSLDITQHTAKIVNEQLLKDADILFVMSKRHADALLRMYPEMQSKLVIPENEIADPYMGSLEVYEQCALQLEREIIKMIEIKKGAV